MRQNKKADCRGHWDFRAEHGRVIAENAPLLRIISRAFQLTDDRVLAPSWLDSQCYDIQAKASRSDAPESVLMNMLQALLKERLLLTAHLETQQRQALDLVEGEGGSKMPKEGTDYTLPRVNPGRVMFAARTVRDLCERIGKVTGQPVIDKTGLTGRYIIILTYTTLGSINADPSDSTPDIAAALRDQLGLRLEPQRAPVEMLRIDSISRTPTAN